MATPEAEPWAAERTRAQALVTRYPFAAEVLGLYLVLLDGWQEVWDEVRAEPPPPARLAHWASERALPMVLKATEAAGPETLAAAARELSAVGGLEESLQGWLMGAGLPPVERYLARASLRAPLAALGEDAAAACARPDGDGSAESCPRCGGPPQLSFRSDADDPLVSGRRSLACARCGHGWVFSSSTCPSCGETQGSRRTIYSETHEQADQHGGPIIGRPGVETDGEGPLFPHLRIEACTGCQRYLIDVDLGRDPRAVPEVDELAALPLAVYAADQGLSKVTPNLMGGLMVEITPGQAYGFFTDTSVCIGCKACEVACKEWNQLPGNDPVFGDGYDNTGQLDAQNWRHVEFIDRVPDEASTVGQGKAWLMMSDVCKHCTHASCLEVCPTGAITRTEFDTVFIQPSVCNGCRDCISACPYGVIEMNKQTGVAQKCTLCYDRLQGSLEPACAKACPTQSIQFGPVIELRERAAKRVDDLHAQGVPEARLYGADDSVYGGLNAFFLLMDEPEVYGLPNAENAVLPSRNNVRGYLTVLVTAVAAVFGGLIALRRRREPTPVTGPTTGPATGPGPGPVPAQASEAAPEPPSASTSARPGEGEGGTR